jgi:hypothetical protein
MTELTAYEPAGVARPDLLDNETDSWVATIAEVARLAAYVCNTPFVPNGLRGNAPATAATILYGREIGVPPITALQTMHVINGRVGMAAELMRARVLAAGHDIEVAESTSAVCRLRGRRRGSETWTEVAWSMGDAKQAGLGGDNWRKYPRAMLTARASAELCRLVFPDVTHGMSALEELDGIGTEVSAPPPTPPRKVARAPRAAAPPTPSPGVSLPPVAAPDPATSEVAGVVSETPPPGEGDPVQAVPPMPPPVVVTAPPPVPPLPGEDDDPPAALPVELAPEDLEADPRAQSELRGELPATPAQVRHVMVLLRRIGMGGTRDERLRIAQAVIQRRVDTFADLTITDAGRLITTLLLAAESDQPRDYLRWLVDEGHRVMDERDAEPPPDPEDTEGET